MKDLFYELRKIVKDKRNYDGLKVKKITSALLILITKVLQTGNSEVCVMAMKSFTFLLMTVDKSFFEMEQVNIYGLLIRSLSYR